MLYIMKREEKRDKGEKEKGRRRDEERKAGGNPWERIGGG